MRRKNSPGCGCCGGGISGNECGCWPTGTAPDNLTLSWSHDSTILTRSDPANPLGPGYPPLCASSCYWVGSIDVLLEGASCDGEDITIPVDFRLCRSEDSFGQVVWVLTYTYFAFDFGCGVCRTLIPLPRTSTTGFGGGNYEQITVDPTDEVAELCEPLLLEFAFPSPPCEPNDITGCIDALCLLFNNAGPITVTE